MCYGSLWGTIFIMVSACIISTTIFLLVRKFGRKFVYDFCDKKKVEKIENSKVFQNPKKIEFIMLILFLIPGTPKEQLAIGDWKMSIILYVAILILVALAVFIINKFDKDKITKDAIKSIK